jgi:hypothetical protein
LSNVDTDRTIGPGHNLPREADAFAESVAERCAVEHAELNRTAAALLDRARQLPESVNDEAALEQFSALVVDMRDAAARAESTRKAVKEPYYRAGQAVDGFFNSVKERLEKGMGVLARRVKDYQNRKLEEERERRRLEAEQRAREERERREKAERAARAAEEARQVAERASKPETQEAKGAEADRAEAEAAEAASAAAVAHDEAEAARIDTLRKPSEIARSRFDSGRLVTMKQVGYVEILDKDKLDKEALWPFLKDEDVLKALRAWAKTKSHKVPMAGAIVEMRDEAVIR